MYLELFDSNTEKRIRDYKITGIDVTDIKKLFNIDPNFEQFGCDVSEDDLPTVERYINEPVVHDPSLIYQIDFYRE